MALQTLRPAEASFFLAHTKQVELAPSLRCLDAIFHRDAAESMSTGLWFLSPLQHCKIVPPHPPFPHLPVSCLSGPPRSPADSPRAQSLHGAANILIAAQAACPNMPPVAHRPRRSLKHCNAPFNSRIEMKIAERTRGDTCGIAASEAFIPAHDTHARARNACMQLLKVGFLFFFGR